MQLDRQSPTPLYKQLYEIIKSEIENIPIGANMPPERQLCERHQLDRVTVRKALALLTNEGYIERKQGRGTCVVRHPGSMTQETILFILYHGTHLVDRFGEPFYARTMDALEKRLQRTGKRLVYSKLRRDESLSHLCAQLEVQGALIAGTLDERMQEQCRESKLPIVGYNTRIGNLPSVMADNEDGAAISAQHLLSLGHRRIGFINVPGFINSEKRLSRFQSEMRKQGLGEQALVVEHGDWTEQGGYLAAMNMLRRAPDITALFGGNDSMAIGALRAAQECGRNVPADLSVIGFDGIAQSALTNPPLTTLQVDVGVMAEAACMLLTHVLKEGVSSGIHAVVSAELVLRGSTGPASVK